MNKIIFDSSTLISLSESCLFHVLRNLNKEMNLEFYIPKGVELETITKPKTINKYKLSSVRIEDAVKEGWLKVYETKEIQDEIKRIEDVANSIYYTNQGNLTIMHLGEAEVIALLNHLNSELIGIDERTVRMLIESPLELKNHMQFKHDEKIQIDKRRLNEFKTLVKNVTIIRSVELISLAYQNGLFKEQLSENPESLAAALYGLKYNGCAISGHEIEDFVNTVKVHA